MAHIRFKLLGKSRIDHVNGRRFKLIQTAQYNEKVRRNRDSAFLGHVRSWLLRGNIAIKSGSLRDKARDHNVRESSSTKGNYKQHAE